MEFMLILSEDPELVRSSVRRPFSVWVSTR